MLLQFCCCFYILFWFSLLLLFYACWVLIFISFICCFDCENVPRTVVVLMFLLIFFCLISVWFSLFRLSWLPVDYFPLLCSCLLFVCFHLIILICFKYYFCIYRRERYGPTSRNEEWKYVHDSYCIVVVGVAIVFTLLIKDVYDDKVTEKAKIVKCIDWVGVRLLILTTELHWIFCVKHWLYYIFVDRFH